ncbi:hypothetical protein FPCIR_12907 [Fusarium pseudocircinatum]|uniref:Uncharacterized protein n=1 Tax=Fusarium pseudocircinatum TaxID=56676 RepID=A0A8H5NT20_9HYPO|nr:hypothetical protein FPCIR_12907 [Fusarium pseudocircinatum]
MAAVTSEDRINRFKEWLGAKAAPQGAVGLKPGSSLLLASALHGLARRAKGHKLTDIEEKAVKGFETVADSEDELVAIGEICSEAKAAARSSTFAAFNAPNAIMTLSEDVPLTREQFDDQVRMLGRETVEQPHIRAVTIDQVHSDGKIDETAEFASATSALGRGVTMFVDPKANPDPATNSATLTVRLQPSIFKCYRRSGELGKDEVYFTWGFGDDAKRQTSHRTPEFGSVVTDTVRDFPSNTPPLEYGTVRKAVAGTAVCWEADHSSSAWYDKLILAMREASRLAADLAHDVGNDALNELIGMLPGFSQYSEMVFWIENIAMVITALLEWLRNKDDKVAEHNYGFSTEFLRNWIGREGYLNFDFNGGGQGRHSMFVKPSVVNAFGP